MKLEEARKIAVDICLELAPFCEKLNIAGSIRRKKAEVKDIEIMCHPKLFSRSGADLFGSTITEITVHPDFIKIVNSLGKIEKGNAQGRYMKIELPQGINLDLFIPEPKDYYRQYAIRTGSADYSFKVIATGWRKQGWVGSDLGLRREEDCIEHKQPDGKSKWECARNKNNEPPVWQSEQEFFEWIKVPYIAPELRNI